RFGPTRMGRTIRRCESGARQACHRSCRDRSEASAAGTQGENRVSTPLTSAGAPAAVEITGAGGRYARMMRLVATDHCVILDGANGTELIDVGGERPEVEEHLWGL